MALAKWIAASGDENEKNGKSFSFRELRMRLQNANKAVPLDVVPERRTKRFPPRFRPVGRFCELSFRYLSPGREGEKRRPLDHM